MIHESFIIIKRRNGISADVYGIMLLNMNRLGVDIALYLYGFATVNQHIQTQFEVDDWLHYSLYVSRSNERF